MRLCHMFTHGEFSRHDLEWRRVKEWATESWLTVLLLLQRQKQQPFQSQWLYEWVFVTLRRSLITADIDWTRTETTSRRPPCRRRVAAALSVCAPTSHEYRPVHWHLPSVLRRAPEIISSMTYDVLSEKCARRTCCRLLCCSARLSVSLSWRRPTR